MKTIKSPFLSLFFVQFTTGTLNWSLTLYSIGDEESKVLYREALVTYLSDKVDTLCSDCQTRYKNNPLRILDCKIDKDSKVLTEAPKPLDYLTPTAKCAPYHHPSYSVVQGVITLLFLL